MTKFEKYLNDGAEIGADGHPPEQAPSSIPPQKPLNIWPPSKFLEWTEPPGNQLLLPAYVTKGELTAFIGQAGVGKSRLFGLWYPICQITGHQWCGIETGGEPQKWLILGDENSIGRIKDDLSHMLPNFTIGEREKIEECLRIQAILDIEDTDLNLADLEANARIRQTVEREAPGGVVIDPLANFAPAGISKPDEMKAVVRMLTATIGRAAPRAARLALHHARTGRQNIIQGHGYDAGNFGSGGKALFATARCQMNLMPGSAEDDTRLVLSCAKSNNCKRFETRGIVFDPATFAYRLDTEFDVEAWKADVEGKARSGYSLCTLRDVVEAVQDGHTTTKGLVEHIREAYQCSKRSVERLISKAVEYEGIKQIARGRYTTGRKAERLLNTDTCK
jgi:hypothetical protein